MGEMKIELKIGSNPMRHRPYRLNPRVKEKVKKEIDKMLEAGIIFAVEEAEWVSPIVLQVGLWWATLFKDAKAYARSCDVCKRVCNPSQ